MRIFEIRDKRVHVSEHALMVPVFKRIWEADKSKTKDSATRKLSYVEFMSSPLRSNPYYELSPEKRATQLGIDLFKDEAYEPDDDVVEAIEWYRSMYNSAVLSLYMYDSVAMAVRSMAEYFRDVDYTGKEGKSGDDPSKVHAMVIKTKELLGSLEDLRNSVEEEVYAVLKHRGNKQINPFEMRPKDS